MKLYTKTGDYGKTDIKGQRVEKNSICIKIIGIIDEFQADICLAKLSMKKYNQFEDLTLLLNKICHDLYLIMGYFSGYSPLPDLTTNLMENQIDYYTDKTPSHPGKFINPGSYNVDAQLNKCRTSCRRVERKLVTIEASELIPYFNRLSDLLYSLQMYTVTTMNIFFGKEAYNVNA